MGCRTVTEIWGMVFGIVSAFLSPMPRSRSKEIRAEKHMMV